MALRPCIGCGRLIARGSRCPDCKLRRPAGNAWRPTRVLVLTRDGYRCRECGSSASLQIDHITPIAAGGTDDLANLQVLCAACNAAKGDR
jgi:5-methylcytosine-specific restriction endonuclease McrA